MRLRVERLREDFFAAFLRVVRLRVAFLRRVLRFGAAFFVAFLRRVVRLREVFFAARLRVERLRAGRLALFRRVDFFAARRFRAAMVDFKT